MTEFCFSNFSMCDFIVTGVYRGLFFKECFDIFWESYFLK